jgi:hypothetical protein
MTKAVIIIIGFLLFGKYTNHSLKVHWFPFVVS